MKIQKFALLLIVLSWPSLQTQPLSFGTVNHLAKRLDGSIRFSKSDVSQVRIKDSKNNQQEKRKSLSIGEEHRKEAEELFRTKKNAYTCLEKLNKGLDDYEEKKKQEQEIEDKKWDENEQKKREQASAEGTEYTPIPASSNRSTGQPMNNEYGVAMAFMVNENVRKSKTDRDIVLQCDKTGVYLAYLVELARSGSLKQRGIKRSSLYKCLEKGSQIYKYGIRSEELLYKDKPQLSQALKEQEKMEKVIEVYLQKGCKVKVDTFLIENPLVKNEEEEKKPVSPSFEKTSESASEGGDISEGSKGSRIRRGINFLKNKALSLSSIEVPKLDMTEDNEEEVKEDHKHKLKQDEQIIFSE